MKEIRFIDWRNKETKLKFISKESYVYIFIFIVIINFYLKLLKTYSKNRLILKENKFPIKHQDKLKFSHFDNLPVYLTW
jgi:hypothetical protein